MLKVAILKVILLSVLGRVASTTFSVLNSSLDLSSILNSPLDDNAINGKH